MVRRVVVFDAADLEPESTFWAGMLGGFVVPDDRFHCVVTNSGDWPVGVQLSPNHVPPDWPDGEPQQVHLDLHVDDPRAAHELALSLGARLLKSDDIESEEGHQVYADPAGHQFCIGWGHPSQAAISSLADRRIAQRGDTVGE